MNVCPCGSNVAYEACCEPVITGKRRPETAGELMRARYTAYTKVAVDFIFETTHPDHRTGYDHEGTKEWAESSEWDELEIVSEKNGGPDDAVGEVEFIARYQEKGVKREHHEVALFKKVTGNWSFTDGKSVTPRPIKSTKVGRNDLCTCGSGLKYKKCCGK